MACHASFCSGAVGAAQRRLLLVRYSYTRLGCGGKSVVCLLQFLRHWRRLEPEVWAAAAAATLDCVLAAMPRAAHDDSTLQVCT